MTGDDLPGNSADARRRGTAPQTYPATPPGYAGNTYQPPEVVPDGSVGVPYGAPGTYSAAPPAAARPREAGYGAAPAVERGELTPVIQSGNALPAGTWQGLDASGAEQLLQSLALPPASPTLAELFNRLMREPVKDAALEAVRRRALMRAGLLDPAQTAQRDGEAMNGAGGTLLQAQMDLVSGQRERGCAAIKQVVAKPQELPERQRGDAIATAGYCAIVAGNRQGGGLAAELARDNGYNRPFTLALLEAISTGEQPQAPLPDRLSYLDGLLLVELGTAETLLDAAALKRAGPGFLGLIANEARASPALRLVAAEQAAAQNVITAAALADAYRAAAGGAGTTTPGRSGPLERAQHFVRAESQQAQFAKTRSIRALLDLARRDGLFHSVAVAVSPVVRQMRPAQEISWFNETAVEVLAVAGDYQGAREWVGAAGLATQLRPGALDHWSMLLDIADPALSPRARGRGFKAVEDLAGQGQLAPLALHRLATVLDALDYNVPVPLWNLASQSQQPQSGHLPATGMLSAMKQASMNGQVAATTLYALHTVAPEGTTATHLLGLGEAIRALKRAGLERHARRLGFEALFGRWPRTG